MLRCLRHNHNGFIFKNTRQNNLPICNSIQFSTKTIWQKALKERQMMLKGVVLPKAREKSHKLLVASVEKTGKILVTSQTGESMMDAMSTNVNKMNRDKKIEETTLSKLQKVNLTNQNVGSVNNNATSMASRIIQTRGVGRVDLVKLGIMKQTNNGKAKGKGKMSVKGKVSDESPNVIVGTELGGGSNQWCAFVSPCRRINR